MVETSTTLASYFLAAYISLAIYAICIFRVCCRSHDSQYYAGTTIRTISRITSAVDAATPTTIGRLFHGAGTTRPLLPLLLLMLMSRLIATDTLMRTASTRNFPSELSARLEAQPHLLPSALLRRDRRAVYDYTIDVAWAGAC